MKYTELNFTIYPKDPWTEIITALLADIGFESFVESESGLLAYIPALVFNPEDIEKLDILKSTEFSVKYEINNIADKNWNAEWERNYNPVIIAEKCCVRAPFHNKDKKCTYDIIIEPKMSFGTAHHETTSLMLEQILALTIKNKSVLDMGCGTAVLAILAAKKGASSVIAIDNDEWAYNNSVENIKKNKTSCINVIMGDSNRISGTFDIILANINRNVLLNDIPKYVDHLDKSGILLLSGFYDSDVPAIKDKAQSLGLKFLDFSAKNKWTVLKFANNE